MDSIEGISIYGNQTIDSSYSVLDLMAVPCSVRESAYSGDDFYEIDPNCHYNKQEVLEWLGPYDLITYTNTATFRPHKYGEERVEFQS